MRTFLRTLLNPAAYQGHRRRPPHFEGWYFKVADAAAEAVYAVIPGIFVHRQAAQSHAFVQLLEGRSGRSHFVAYAAEAFQAAEGTFDVTIGPNRFTATQLQLDIHTPELRLAGQLHFPAPVSWPVSLLSPGIMGWYAWVPFMECYHGVVSLDHAVEGVLQVNGRAVDFGGGRGYTEKDWGRAFPDAWVWMQSNHFDQVGVSLTASYAIIPWLRNPFLGFIVGLWFEGTLYPFATYTGARVRHFRLTEDAVEWAMESRSHHLELRALRTQGGLLHAPAGEGMVRRVAESLDAEIEVRLSAVGDGRTVYQGRGRHGGLETGGNIARLLQMTGAEG